MCLIYLESAPKTKSFSASIVTKIQLFRFLVTIRPSHSLLTVRHYKLFDWIQCKHIPSNFSFGSIIKKSLKVVNFKSQVTFKRHCQNVYLYPMYFVKKEEIQKHFLT